MQFDPATQPLTFDQLMAMLPVRIGQPFNAADLRDSIQRLYQTGEYADIAVDATLSAAGVNLKFITKPAYFIGYFDVSGVPEPPNDGQLLVATKLHACSAAPMRPATPPRRSAVSPICSSGTASIAPALSPPRPRGNLPKRSTSDFSC